MTDQSCAGLTAEEKRWALECLEAGDGVNELARMSGRSEEVFRQALDLPDLTGVEDSRAIILLLFEMGYAKRVIGAATGVGINRVNHILSGERRAGRIQGRPRPSHNFGRARHAMTAERPTKEEVEALLACHVS